MNEFDIIEVTEDLIEDLCRVCIPADRLDDPDWMRGVLEKKRWALGMLNRWGSLAKVAYKDGTPVGLIQYRPIPHEQTVNINCIYVPHGGGAVKGTASRLLSRLMDDVTRPMNWFDERPPLALVTNSFEGGEPGQLTAREFFKRKGFRQVADDPDHMYYPLKRGFVYAPVEKKAAGYIPQDEDRGKVLLVCGPNGCPATYPFLLKRMEKYIREICPEVPIRWLDSSEEPEELRRRNARVGDCIANAGIVKSYVLDKASFQEEVKVKLGHEETSL